ncbi:MAG: globin domain-containing protein [Caulobacteraceae bacterium]
MKKTNPAQAQAIEGSLEIAAERGGDLTGRVYQRLFARHPEMEALFWRDLDGAIKGEMLTRALEAILDFIGERCWADHLLGAEVVTHEGYDVPRAVFTTFFPTVCEAVQEACGEAWTGAMAAAWTRLLADLNVYVSPSAPTTAE